MREIFVFVKITLSTESTDTAADDLMITGLDTITCAVRIIKYPLSCVGTLTNFFRKEMKSMAKTTVKLGYTALDGGKETRSINNINPEATGETLLSMANKFMSLQDDSVKTLSSVKRVDTTDLM